MPNIDLGASVCYDKAMRKIKDHRIMKCFICSKDLEYDCDHKDISISVEGQNNGYISQYMIHFFNLKKVLVSNYRISVFESLYVEIADANNYYSVIRISEKDTKMLCRKLKSGKLLNFIFSEKDIKNIKMENLLK